MMDWMNKVSRRARELAIFAGVVIRRMKKQESLEPECIKEEITSIQEVIQNCEKHKDDSVDIKQHYPSSLYMKKKSQKKNWEKWKRKK